MREPFRVGIDPGWGSTFEAHMGEFVRESLDSRSDIRWEIMPRPPGRTAVPAIIDQYDGLLVLGMRFDATSFEGVKRLICLSRWGVGFDMIDIAAATQANVMVSLTPDAITRAVAEAQIALIFALAKRVLDLDRRTRAGLWRDGMPIVGTDLAGKTLTSVGLGRIAREMFNLARAIGFGRLLAYDPFCPPDRAAAAGVELVDLATVMAEGDFVTVNTFLDDSTRGMIGTEQFALMKPTAYFVNTARGPIVREAALIDALRQGRIAGAGIDVFEQEPTPRDNPLLAMENVIVSPHGMAWTREGLAGNSRDCCRNILAVARGEVPPCLADPDAALRSGVQAKLARWREL